ncbi:MAG: FtsX-like permease family protein [Desulfuromonadales bacterium]|nr:FtsX-like permease family protein [Desulfuromonadales bacterium]
MNAFLYAWRSLWRNRRRTLITLTAIALSIMLVQAFHNLAVGAYARMIDDGVRAGSGHLAVYRHGYLESREENLGFSPANLAAQIRAIPGVTKVLPRVYLPALAQSSHDSRGILLIGVEPEAELTVNPFLKGLSADAMLRDIDGRDAVIGKRLLDDLKLAVGRKLVVTAQHRDGTLHSELLRVRGVVSTGMPDIDGSLLMVGRQRAALLTGMQDDIHELAIILNDSDEEAFVAAAITPLLHDRPELAAVSWEKAMPNLANAIKLDYASQKFIFVIILLIVTIGVVNTLLMSVMERLREFGVVLALGSSPGRLRRLVLIEALLLGMVAAVAGCVLGALATWYLVDIGIDLKRFIPETLEFGGVVFDPVLRAAWDLAWMAKIALYVVGLTLLAALYPAIKAGRITPVEAMRHH